MIFSRYAPGGAAFFLRRFYISPLLFFRGRFVFPFCCFPAGGSSGPFLFLSVAVFTVIYLHRYFAARAALVLSCSFCFVVFFVAFAVVGSWRRSLLRSSLLRSLSCSDYLRRYILYRYNGLAEVVFIVSEKIFLLGAFCRSCYIHFMQICLILCCIWFFFFRSIHEMYKVYTRFQKFKRIRNFSSVKSLIFQVFFVPCIYMKLRLLQLYGIILLKRNEGREEKRGFPGCRLENLSRLNGCRRCCRMSQTFTPCDGSTNGDGYNYKADSSIRQE